MSVQHKTIDIGGRKVSYTLAGDPKNTPLVFLHGWGARTGKYISQEHVISEFAKYYYVVAPEHPGLIRSEPPNKIWVMSDFVDNLHELFMMASINTFILVGQSFGGGIATQYAGTYPKSVRSLVLIDSVYPLRRSNWYFKLRYLWEPIFSWILATKRVPILLKKLLINCYLGVPWNNITRDNAIKWIHLAKTNIRSIVTTDLSTLTMPVILIWGKKDTFMTPIDDARNILLKNIPHAKFFEVEGGHTFLYKFPKRAGDIMKKELS